MFHSLYNAGIYGYTAVLRLASLFHPKAKLWTDGRRGVFEKIADWRSQQKGKVYWFHAASLGEFEQGRPIIEAIKKSDAEIKIVLTFFSPSGYEIRKNYSGADLVVYLPADTPSNAKRWIAELKPDTAVFIKYEYWANYFFELKKSRIPLVVISAIFREGQRFFGFQQSFWKRVLSCVDHFFLQNQSSLRLLNGLGEFPCTVAGDTRYDRVIEIAEEKRRIEKVEQFIGRRKALIVGSSYEAEQRIIQSLMASRFSKEWCYIVAPHEMDQSAIDQFIAHCGSGKAIRYSQYSASFNGSVMVIDNIGMLSALYRYGNVALIGGGFGRGLHNALEAAVYGIPVAYGPNHQKFDEARLLVAEKGAATADTTEELTKKLAEMMEDDDLCGEMGHRNEEIIRRESGAIRVIMSYFEKNSALK
ncbi:MAG: 3-deoxy-D-manno-octulosonic acid transferase [Flavobacteriales bacterium]